MKVKHILISVVVISVIAMVFTSCDFIAAYTDKFRQTEETTPIEPEVISDTFEVEEDQAVPNNIMFQNSQANFAFIYPHDSLTLSSLYYGGEAESGKLTLDVSITLIDSLEGIGKDSAVSERDALERGEYGTETDFSYGPSRKIINVGAGDVNVKQYMVLEYNSCYAVFEQYAVFYNNNYRVAITLSADSDAMIEEIGQYFIDDDSCQGGKAWAPGGKDEFYDSLLTGNVSPLAAKWQNAFDDIMYLLQINDFKGASAGYSRVTDNRYFEENEKEKYRIEAAYPQFESAVSGGLDDSINERIYDGTVIPIINAFKEEILSYDYEDENLIYFLTVDYRIVTFDNNMISLVLETYPYMGGAHGLLYYRTFNFDLGKSSMIGLEDIFMPGYDYASVMSEYCRSDLALQMQERGFDVDMDWIKEGTDPDRSSNFMNFLVTPEGLLIKFPAYQVAPYAAGDFSVIIGYDCFEGFISPDSPVNEYL